MKLAWLGLSWFFVFSGIIFEMVVIFTLKAEGIFQILVLIVAESSKISLGILSHFKGAGKS